jgi:hypothetical protein
MKPQTPTNLRHWEQRAAAHKLADGLLRADRARARRMAANDDLGGSRAPAPNGPFAALRNHPQYRGPRLGSSRP